MTPSQDPTGKGTGGQERTETAGSQEPSHDSPGLPPDPQGPVAVRTRVRSSIADSGLAQREFARRIGLDETKLSKSLRGTRRFSPPELLRIAEVGQVTVAWLLSGAGPGQADGTAGPSQQPGLRGAATAESGPRASGGPAAGGAAGTPGGPSGPGGAGTGQHVPERRRKQRIVEAGARLFAARGLHAVRISEIAAECDLSTSAVYHYFTSKRELFEEVLRHMAARALDEQVATLGLAEGPAERLRHLIELRLPTAGARADEWSIWVQGWAEVAVGAGASTNQTEAYDRWNATVLEVLREGQEAGVIIRGPTEELCLQLTSLLDGLGLKVLTGSISVERMRTALHENIECFLVSPAEPSDHAATSISHAL